MNTFLSKSELETEKIGEELSAKLKKGDVVAFYGDLGMGKTAFVRGLAKGLGVEDTVHSPTFSLVHEHDGIIPLYHFDMYRITGMDDLYSTGFFDYLNSGGILAVEWSENIEGALPENFIKVEISRGNSDEERIIKISGGDV